MARLKELTYMMGATISMGKGTFEFVKLDVGEMVELDAHDDAARVHAIMVRRVQGKLEEKVLEIRAVAAKRELATEVVQTRRGVVPPRDDKELPTPRRRPR